MVSPGNRTQMSSQLTNITQGIKAAARSLSNTTLYIYV
jgi:hypothetical protein